MEIKMPDKNPQIAYLSVYIPEFIREEKSIKDKVYSENGSVNNTSMKKADKIVRKLILTKFAGEITTVVKDLEKLGFSDITYVADADFSHVIFRGKHEDSEIYNMFFKNIYGGSWLSSYVKEKRSYSASLQTIRYAIVYGELIREIDPNNVISGSWDNKRLVIDIQRKLKKYCDINASETRTLIGTLGNWVDQQPQKERDEHVHAYGKALRDIGSGEYYIKKKRDEIAQLETEIAVYIQQVSEASQVKRYERKWLTEHEVTEDSCGNKVISDD